MEIQYRLHIKDRNGVTFIAIINPVPNIPGLVEEKFGNIANAIKNQLDYYRSLYLGKEYCYFITGMDIAGE